MMPPLEPVLYLGALGLVVIGVAGMVLLRHLFRVLLALALAEAGANLFLVLAGYRWDAMAPILLEGMRPAAMVDPLPQAMVLTAIVIGVGVQALAIALLVRVSRGLGTLDRRQVRDAMEAGIAEAAGLPLAESQQQPGVPGRSGGPV